MPEEFGPKVAEVSAPERQDSRYINAVEVERLKAGAALRAARTVADPRESPHYTTGILVGQVVNGYKQLFGIDILAKLREKNIFNRILRIRYQEGKGALDHDDTLYVHAIILKVFTAHLAELLLEGKSEVALTPLACVAQGVNNLEPKIQERFRAPGARERFVEIVHNAEKIPVQQHLMRVYEFLSTPEA